MPRRLVICCDGTWNRPDQHSDGVPAPTNVTKVALGVDRKDEAGADQLLFYQPGVGTRRFERLRGGAFGIGLSRNVRDCYRFLVENYRPGDELYFFGFSRGAFTARSTVGLVRNSGILRAEHVGRIKDAYRLYRDRAKPSAPNGIEAEIFRRMYSHDDRPIRFVGVWDTVGALGIPSDAVRLPLLTRRWTFHDTTLSSRVQAAFHAVAIDERRKPFKPTLWVQQPHAGDQTLEQVWFAGVHCDVGGGYREQALAEIPLLWMVKRARECGLAFKPDHFLTPDGQPDEESRRLGKHTAPDPLGEIHESYKSFYRLLPPRWRPLTGAENMPGDSPPGSALHLAVASTAVARAEGLPGYAPPELADYLAAGEPVTEVAAPA
ncbi:MAG TPA: DUF2235 domain-containing protein [Thermoleophilaceae bacterium]|nr:DUF2235 domain-containing protein [Thermoleophilaceae bacterium]